MNEQIYGNVDLDSIIKRLDNGKEMYRLEGDLYVPLFSMTSEKYVNVNGYYVMPDVEHGALHSRPAASLVKFFNSSYPGEVYVVNLSRLKSKEDDTYFANAKAILGVMMLQANVDNELRFLYQPPEKFSKPDGWAGLGPDAFRDKLMYTHKQLRPILDEKPEEKKK